ncbi:hypothetical protein [Planctomyces sp. SH-PL62]|uniref:hypothetical protein n=1 Tax=Planctomyces sp. SH-PL62 TaxID=1636152 RepID=UPI0012E81785|nr:hypothetical protein [Planctomyces sp. SH-PL62]
MSWQPDKARWRKMVKGRWYFVTPETLGAPPTKEASAAKANAWMRAKLAELAAAEEVAHPHAPRLSELARRVDWARRNGEDAAAANIEAEIGLIRSGESPADDAWILEEAFRAQFGQVPPSIDQLRMLYATESVWRDRLARVDAVPPDRTIAARVARFLELERARLDAGDISGASFDGARRCLGMFRDWCGPELDVSSIDADRFEGWWLHLVGTRLSTEYKKKLLRHARTFIEWLASKRLVPLPPNLSSRRYRFGGSPAAVPTLPPETVRKLIEGAPGQLRLHLLLMANCGMGQKDISDIRPEEIDWRRGRITRKRSKTSDRETVPTVEYPLWPETWELLEGAGHRTGDHALKTESGRAWVREWTTEDGVRHKCDAVKSNYAHLARRLKIQTPMKLIRKTSSSLLDTHETHSRYALLFLGHSPRSIADRHYIKPSQDRFDAAVRWLREAYGFGS